MKKSVRILLQGLVIAVCAGSAEANFVIDYTAPSDPTTLGFTVGIVAGSSTRGPIADDGGTPAWFVAGQGVNSQYAYQSGTLTNAQKADIANQGFVLTMTARALKNLAPAYDSVSHVVIAGADLDMNARRYGMELGLDANGDTVVVLPTSVSLGSGGVIRAPGPSYTLTGSGSSYHTYQLVYDQNTLLSKLFVDGTERLSGYAGFTSFADNRGLEWGTWSGGQGNFYQVQLASVPLPAAAWLFGTALAGLGISSRRKSGN